MVINNNQCKRCRRLRQKLFLKGERCFSPKCPLIRKPYPPGIRGRRPTRVLSEYGRQLIEKQKLKALYGISEEQLKRYFKKAISKKGKVGPADDMIETLEGRLDSAIFHLGWAPSHRAARQMVSHGRVLVNNRSTNIPSQQIKIGDILTIKKPQQALLKEIKQRLKDHPVPSWFSLDKSAISAKVLKRPVVEELEVAVDMPLVIEYFSH